VRRATCKGAAARSVTAALIGPVCASGERASVTGANRALAACLRSPATPGLRPARTCISRPPEPGRRRSPAPSGHEDSERGVAGGSRDRDRSGGEAAGARRHLSKQCSCISRGFRAGAGDLSQRNGTPTRFNNRDRIPTSRPLRPRGLALDRAESRGRCPDTQPPAGTISRGRQSAAPSPTTV
jgi:hypothetical protein